MKDEFDLFGNPRVTPRQIMAQQMADAMRMSQGGDTALSRGTSMMGAAFGSLLGAALIDAGVLPKPPEMQEAERQEKWRSETMALASKQGVSPTDDPGSFYDLAAEAAMKIGADDLALRAVQAKQLYAAKQRAATREAAETLKAQTDAAENMMRFTPESRAEFQRTGDLGVLRVDPNSPVVDRSAYFKDFTNDRGEMLAFDARSSRVIDPATGQPVTDPARLRPLRASPDATQALAYQGALGRSFGTKTGQARFDLPKVESTAANMLDQIEKAKADPTLRAATGPILGRLPIIFGAQAKGASRLEQLKGSAFLYVYESLRGGGHISNAEGEKAQAAISRLQSVQTTEDFLAGLDELAGVIRRGLERARKQAYPEQYGNAPVMPGKSAPAPQPDNAPRMRVLDTKSWTLK